MDHDELAEPEATKTVFSLEKELVLLQRVIEAANEAGSADETLHAALDAVCEYTEWPIGHAYLVSDPAVGEQAPTKLWHLEDPDRFSVFREVTEATVMPRGVGLPGRVLESGAPAWIIDVTKDPNFPRARVAVDIGVRGAFGFPVRIGEEVVGMLEFFTDKPQEPDPSLLEFMELVGVQVGRAIERERTLAALEDSERKYRAAVDTAVDAVVSADHSGAIIYFNPAAEALFGYTAVEVIGRNLTVLMPEPFVERHNQGFARYQRTGEPRVIGRTVELVGRRRSGSEFPLELSLAKWDTGEGTFFTGFIRDLSERKQAEGAARRLELMKQQQRQALEIHDNIVQGLAVALMALELDRDELSRDALKRTLASAQSIVGQLIKRSKEEGGALGPGDFIRDKAAFSSKKPGGGAR